MTRFYETDGRIVAKEDVVTALQQASDDEEPIGNAPLFDVGESVDLRNHRSMLISGYERECLAALDRGDHTRLYRLLCESREFYDYELEDAVWTWVAFKTSRNGARADLTGRVAVTDKPVHRVERDDLNDAEPVRI